MPHPLEQRGTGVVRGVLRVLDRQETAGEARRVAATAVPLAEAQRQAAGQIVRRGKVLGVRASIDVDGDGLPSPTSPAVEEGVEAETNRERLEALALLDPMASTGP